MKHYVQDKILITIFNFIFRTKSLEKQLIANLTPLRSAIIRSPTVCAFAGIFPDPQITVFCSKEWEILQDKSVSRYEQAYDLPHPTNSFRCRCRSPPETLYPRQAVQARFYLWNPQSSKTWTGTLLFVKPQVLDNLYKHASSCETSYPWQPVQARFYLWSPKSWISCTGTLLIVKPQVLDNLCRHASIREAQLLALLGWKATIGQGAEWLPCGWWRPPNEAI